MGIKKPFKYYTYQEKTGPYPNSLISNILDIWDTVRMSWNEFTL